MERIASAGMQAKTKAMMVSIEGGSRRLYMGAVPANAQAGHLVSGWYQVIVPNGVDVFATAEPGTAVVVANFPPALLTDGDDGYPRLRVDVML